MVVVEAICAGPVEVVQSEEVCQTTLGDPDPAIMGRVDQDMARLGKVDPDPAITGRVDKDTARLGKVDQDTARLVKGMLEAWVILKV